MAIYDRECRYCGITFKGGPRAWYCPECRRLREAERAKKYRNDGFQRHLGDIDICKNCGKKYIVQSGPQKYCPDCKIEMERKLGAKQSLEYYNKNKDEINPKRNERRRAIEKSCVVCGKLFYSPDCSKCCSEECSHELLKSNQRLVYDKRRRQKNKDDKQKNG